MLQYDTTYRLNAPIRRKDFARDTLAYLAQMAHYREDLARRIYDLMDYDIPSADLPAMLRLIDKAADLSELNVMHYVTLTLEQMADDSAR